MNKKEVMEIKRRLKKEGCTFTRMCGCYVDAEKNKVGNFGQTFLNLEDEEFYKYLEIAKKVLSGNIGNNQTVFAEHPADNGGFTHVGLSDNRHTDAVVFFRAVRFLREMGNYLVQHFAQS